MASLATIYRQLRAEIAGRLTGLVPNLPNVPDRMGGRFQVYGEDKAEATPIESFTGHPRSFYVGQYEDLGAFSVGHTARAREYHIPLTIVYRTGFEWDMAVLDDIEEIKHDILNSATDTGITGVQCRFVDPEIPPQIIRHPKDPWQHVTLRVRALLEIT